MDTSVPIPDHDDWTAMDVLAPGRLVMWSNGSNGIRVLTREVDAWSCPLEIDTNGWQPAGWFGNGMQTTDRDHLWFTERNGRQRGLLLRVDSLTGNVTPARQAERDQNPAAIPDGGRVITIAVERPGRIRTLMHPHLPA